MRYSRRQVQKAIKQAFPNSDAFQILARLDAYGTEDYERERERVQLAIVALTEGVEDKLDDYIAVAKRDYRDVLFWAEYPEESKVDTPEKKHRLRELFVKLGITPPAKLDK